MASTATHDWPMVRLGDVLQAAGVPEKVSSPELESFVTVKIHGEGAVQRNIGTGKTPAAFTGYRVKEGQFIYSRIDARNGAFALIPQSLDGAVVSKDFPIFDIDESKCMPKYLHYFAASGILAAKAKALSFGATNRQRVKEEVFLRFEIPLPPIDEQRRIAAILDEGDEALVRVNQSLGDLLQLKQELFTDFFLRIERESTVIGEYLESTQYGTSDKANENAGIPILRMGNVSYNGGIDFSNLKYVELDTKDREKYSLKAGDLLFNRTNSKELVGKTAVVPSLVGEYTYAGYLIRCRVNDKAVPEYIAGFLNSVLGKKILRNTAKAIVGMANINANELKRLPIPKASMDEQQEFASSISRIEDIESQMKRQRKLLQELQKTLSIRAFQGEL